MQKHLYILLIIFGFAPYGWAQNTTNVLDSLQNILDNTESPTKKVSLLLEMGNHVRITQSTNDAIPYIDKAKQTAEELGLDELLAEVSIEKGKILAGQGKYEEAENLFKNALLIYEKTGNEQFILSCLNGLGIINRRKGDYQTAVQYLERATTYFSDSISVQNKGAVLSNLSNIYSRLNQFSLAYEKIYEGLKYYEKAGFTRGIGLAYGNLGILYKTHEDYDNAIPYFHKSLEILEKENDLRGQYTAYNNLSGIYTSLGDYQLALAKNKQQLDIAIQLEASDLVVISKINRAGNYIELDNFKKAQDILVSLKDDMEGINKRYQFTYLLTYSLFHKEQKEYNKGIEYGEKAYEVGNELGDYSELTLILELLHELYEKTGNYKKAYNSLAEFKMFSDSLNSEKNIRELTTQKMQFEFDKEKETVDLEKKALESTLRTQNITRWAAIIFAILISIIGLISFRNSRKQNRLLTEDLKNKQTIEAQSKELQTFNAKLEETVAKRTVELEQANYELRTFNYIASHDIKEPIRNIGNYVGWIFKKLPPDLKDSLGDYFNIIKQNTSQLYTLIEDFAHYMTLSKDEDIELQPVDLKSVVTNIQENLQESIQQYNGQIIIKDLPTIQSSNSLLSTALKNLIENGLKYNESEQPTVEISYSDTEEQHQITVSDNGIGISKEYHQQVFEMFKRLHNREVYKGTGMGLAIVKLVIGTLKGEVSIVSEAKKGSQFTIMLPKEKSIS